MKKNKREPIEFQTESFTFYSPGTFSVEEDPKDVIAEMNAYFDKLERKEDKEDKEDNEY